MNRPAHMGIAASRAWLVAVLFGALQLYAADFARDESNEEQTFFYSLGKQVPVTISTDKIGILVAEGVTETQVNKYAQSHGLTPVGVPIGRIYIYQLTNQQDRTSLALFARKVRKQAPHTVVQAGLVATPVGGKVPMVITDRVIAQIKSNAKREDLETLTKKLCTEIIFESPLRRGLFLLRFDGVDEPCPTDALQVANQLEKLAGPVKYAHPDFVKAPIFLETVPNDPLFGDQWHLRNTGQKSGTPGADARATRAWDINRGDPSTVIAVIDTGFDVTHADLASNLWVNPAETLNGSDDDNNSFIDDLNGWNFIGCDSDPPPPNCGSADLSGDPNHGTAVAGIAAASTGNHKGVAGACPQCKLMLLKPGYTDYAQASPFDYAKLKNASVITNSWTIPAPCTTYLCTAIDDAATSGRGGLGAVVLFAMSDDKRNDCLGTEFPTLPSVMAISGSTNLDLRELDTGYGNCMALLAPTAMSSPNSIPSPRRTLWITTTDVTGTQGYNHDVFPTDCPTPAAASPPDARDYTGCFWGTSAATPLVAGVAGLVLSANSSLTRLEVQRLLQDTADKIEPSAAAYSPSTGFSGPAPGDATHGFGRVNAFEAVRVAATGGGGRSGVDIFLRDNELDWGNTDQPSNMLFESTRGYIPHWHSMDIKVDSPTNGYQMSPTSATFDSFVDETPSATPGDMNRVYVRVHNRGPRTAAMVDVKLHWAQFGTALPVLPADFWIAFPADSIDTTSWHPLSCAIGAAGLPSSVCRLTGLGYSGASVAGTANDQSQIVRFDFPAPTFASGLTNHFCLLAMVDSPQDPISQDSRTMNVVDQITPTDNNVTHRNYANLSVSPSAEVVETFLVRNPLDLPIDTYLVRRAPLGWELDAIPYGFNNRFILQPGEEVLIKLRINAPSSIDKDNQVTITQMIADQKRPLGGITLNFFSKQ